MKLVITLSTLLPLTLAASLAIGGGNEEAQSKPLEAEPTVPTPVTVAPETMRALIAKVAQRVVQGRTFEKREELQKPDSLTAEDVQNYYLASEQALQTPRQVEQSKTPAGLTAEEFQQYLNAAIQFQPTAKYHYYPQTVQRGFPIKTYATGGNKVKRGNAVHRSGYGGGWSQPPSAEYHTYDEGSSHHHESHYPAKVLHYDEEDARTRNAVFDALWRAFQAITGGVMVIGGHIAKGSGYLLQAKGRLLAETGPAVSEFGRSIAAESLHPHHPAPVHHYKASPYVVRHVHRYVSKPVYGPHKPYYKSYVPESSYHPSDIAEFESAVDASLDTHRAIKVAAKGTTRAIGDLVRELSNTAARAYLIKE